MRIRQVTDFGALVRQRRRDLGLSQQELADRTGVTRQWLVRFERGNPDVTLSKMYAVLSGLGLIVRADSPDAPSGIQYDLPKVDPALLEMSTTAQRSWAEIREALQRMGTERD